MKQLYSVLAALLLGGHGAVAAVVLKVDISDPSAVVITATGSPANVSASLRTFEHGISLVNFFSGTDSKLSWGTGDLTTGANVTTARFDDYSKTSDKRLVLYDYNGTQPLVFSTSAPAFTGSVVFDFSAFAAQLPSAGSTDHVLGWDGDSIGHYTVTVVPEPSLALLGVAGLAAFGLVRHRSRKQS